MIDRVHRKIVAGKWQGAYLSPKIKRGIVRIRTEGGDVTVLAYHAVLLRHGCYPQGDKRVCSHICHNPQCVDIEHLRWSDANENSKREQCRNNNICDCELSPPCRFDCS